MEEYFNAKTSNGKNKIFQTQIITRSKHSRKPEEKDWNYL